MRSAGVLAALLLAASSAAAAGSVVVLEPRASSAFAWPAGERAVVAELMANDAEIVIRPTTAETAAALEREVVAAALEPDTRGAVGVGRDGDVGFAHVAVHGSRYAVRIEDDVREGPVAEGAVALRVSEVLSVRRFDLPPDEPPAPPPPVEPATPEPKPRLWPWLALAGVATRGASGVAPAAALGLRVPITSWLSLEPSGALTLDGLEVQTAAGDVALSARQATLELVVAPTERQGFVVGAGLGAGLAWLWGTPRAQSGYRGLERSTEVSLLALRAFGGWHGSELRVLAFMQASLFLPAVTIRASERELARLGQPWFMGGLALGYSP